MKLNLFLVLFIFVLGNSFAQDTLTASGPVSLGDLTIDYKKPKEYEIGPIQVVGADNFDHQAIKLIAGLRQGQTIFIPGDQIAKAIKNPRNNRF